MSRLALWAWEVRDLLGAKAKMFSVASSRIDLLEPWEEFGPGQADAFLLELSRELSPGHPLHGVQLDPIGHSRAADDVLFAAHDGRVAEVHLTWSRRAEQPPWPMHRFYSNLDEWIEHVVLPEHDGQ